MMFWRSPILVVGSAHLDVIGEYFNEGFNDSQGEVFYAIGGTAYNIAVNLADNHLPVQLLSYLKKKSSISRLIRRRLIRNRVGIRHIAFRTKIAEHGRGSVEIPESGYVAHRFRGTRNVTAAVSCTAISRVEIPIYKKDRRRLRRAIKRAKIVAADCNLSARTLRFIIQTCAEVQRKLIIHVVSDDKTENLKQAVQGGANAIISAVVGNIEEVAWALDDLRQEIRKIPDKRVDVRRPAVEQLIETRFSTGLAQELTGSLRSEAVLMTSGEKSGVLLFNNGEYYKLDGPGLSDAQIKSRTGTSDAWAAGLVEYLYRNGELPRTQQQVQNFADCACGHLMPVLQQLGPTRNCLLTLEEDEDTGPHGLLGRIYRFFRISFLEAGVHDVARAIVGIALLQALVEGSKKLWPSVSTASNYIETLFR